MNLPNKQEVMENTFGPLATEGDVAPFFELYDWLFSETEEARKDLVWKLMCYKTQNLTTHIDLGLMLVGVPGSGKSMLSKIVSQMVAPHHRTICFNELDRHFNPWLENALIVSVEEDPGRRRRDDTQNALDILRAWITNTRPLISTQYSAPRHVANHTFFIYANTVAVIGAPAEGDPLISVSCPGPHPDGKAFYERVAQWRDCGGLYHLLHYFQNYDLEGWKPPSLTSHLGEENPGG